MAEVADGKGRASGGNGGEGKKMRIVRATYMVRVTNSVGLSD